MPTILKCSTNCLKFNNLKLVKSEEFEMSEVDLCLFELIDFSYFSNEKYEEKISSNKIHISFSLFECVKHESTDANLSTYDTLVCDVIRVM